MQKERYVFVAHFGADAQVGGKVTYYLRERGLRVWYEAWDNYINMDKEQLSQELRGTKFFLPVLSSRTLAEQKGDDNWLNLPGQAKEDGIMIIPVLCDHEITEVLPPILKDMKKIRMGITFENDLNELIFATALDDHIQLVKKKERLTTPAPPLRGFLEECENDMGSAGWPVELSSRQILISSKRTIRPLTPEALISIIGHCPIKISGWSGSSFPFPLPLGQPFKNDKTGVAFLDKHPWIGEDFSFYYWKFNSNGYFLQRQHLHEDHNTELKTLYLSPELLIIWISQGLRFAQKLLAYLPQDTQEVKIEFLLQRMKEKQLLWHYRSGFHGEYRTDADVIAAYAKLGLKTDLLSTALEVSQYIFSRFASFCPPMDSLKRSLTMLCDGRYYKLE